MSTRQLISATAAKPPFFAGVDLGGTNIKVGLVDDLGRPMSWVSVPTDPRTGAEDAARRMGEAVLEAVKQAGAERERVVRVGLGSPGTMDIPAGKLLEPPNLPGWDNFPIRDRVSYYAGLPVSFANDGGAAAYGEFWVGSGEDFRSMVLLTLGTGIGGGIIVNNFSLDGEHSHGAECGHIIIDYQADARVCNCGRKGHLEGYASATALVKRTQEALDSGRKSSLSHRLDNGEKLTPILIGMAAETGDSLAEELIMETAMYLGVGVVSLMHTIDPDGVVLGGAMTFGGHETELGRRFLQRIKQEVDERAFPIPAQKTVIDYARLGGDAGFIGAAGIARADYHREKG
jgi:glucokinase